MKKAVFLLSAVISLSGCLGREQAEVVCEDIVKAVDSDPGSLKINKTSSLSGSLRAEDIERYYSLVFPGGIPSASRMLMVDRIENIDQYKDVFVQVDYTTKNAMGGPVRDTALCRYFDWGKEKQLVSITVFNKDYEYDKFLGVFLTRERPKGLDSLYRVK